MTRHACFRACACISAYDETLRKELEATPARKSTVYIMCSEYWKVRPDRVVSLRRGTGHRLMGQIMVRLIRAGSMFVGLEQKREGSKDRGEGKEGRKDGHTVPPRLSLSAGFTWIGLFICDRERKRSKERTHNRKRRKKREKTRDKEASKHHVIAHAFALRHPLKKKKNFFRITQPNCG